MEIVIAFARTGDAIRAEQMLLDAGLRPRAMSLPGAIRAGCGICLRLDPEDRERGAACLHGLDTEWYERTPAGDGRSVYKEAAR